MPHSKAVVQAYVEQHDLTTKLQDALQHVVEEQTPEPLGAIAAHLTKGATAAPAAGSAGLLPRPRTAHGKFLRILTVNDVYAPDRRVQHAAPHAPTLAPTRARALPPPPLAGT